MLKMIITVLLIAISMILIALVMMQDSQNKGLGAIGGMASHTDTYWGKNKGRSKEGRLKKATVVCVVLLIALTVLLNAGYV